MEFENGEVDRWEFRVTKDLECAGLERGENEMTLKMDLTGVDVDAAAMGGQRERREGTMVRMEVDMERREDEEDTPWPQEEDNKYGGVRI